MNIYKIHTNILYLSVMAIVFNATFNNITVISWRLFYLLEYVLLIFFLLNCLKNFYSQNQLNCEHFDIFNTRTKCTIGYIEN
jgi:hypothetical protein